MSPRHTAAIVGTLGAAVITVALLTTTRTPAPTPPAAAHAAPGAPLGRVRELLQAMADADLCEATPDGRAGYRQAVKDLADSLGLTVTVELP